MDFLHRLMEDNDGDTDEYAMLGGILTALLVLLTQWLHVPWELALVGVLFLCFLAWRWKVWS